MVWLTWGKISLSVYQIVINHLFNIIFQIISVLKDIKYILEENEGFCIYIYLGDSHFISYGYYRGWAGWMASLTQWAWVWASSWRYIDFCTAMESAVSTLPPADSSRQCYAQVHSS